MSETSLDAARTALDECDAVVDRLHAMCCEPDRSPRMLAIKERIAVIRKEIDGGTGSLEAALTDLNEVGGQLGSLQVACCAPPRMPLYAAALEQLTTAQLGITASLGRRH